ncbi:MAG: hypothetical protein L0G87_12695, partial [Renibacterium salmoninarum]|nr:hypothetical protein [Renibacterium salmoninarum]
MDLQAEDAACPAVTGVVAVRPPSGPQAPAGPGAEFGRGPALRVARVFAGVSGAAQLGRRERL